MFVKGLRLFSVIFIATVDISAGVGAFVIGLSQILSFYSYYHVCKYIKCLVMGVFLVPTDHIRFIYLYTRPAHL